MSLKHLNVAYTFEAPNGSTYSIESVPDFESPNEIETHYSNLATAIAADFRSRIESAGLEQRLTIQASQEQLQCLEHGIRQARNEHATGSLWAQGLPGVMEYLAAGLAGFVIGALAGGAAGVYLGDDIPSRILYGFVGAVVAGVGGAFGARATIDVHNTGVNQRSNEREALFGPLQRAVAAQLER